MTFYDHASELQHLTGCHDMLHIILWRSSGRWWFRLFQDLLAKIAIEKSKDTWSSAKAEEHGRDLAGCRNRRGRQRFWTGVGTRHPLLLEETQYNCAVDGESGWWICRRFRGESAIEFLCRVKNPSCREQCRFNWRFNGDLMVLVNGDSMGLNNHNQWVSSQPFRHSFRSCRELVCNRPLGCRDLQGQRRPVVELLSWSTWHS
jgi:hypothetical protein